MKLIALVVVFVLLRYGKLPFDLSRLGKLTPYWEIMQSALASSDGMRKGWAGALIVLLPIPLLFALLYHTLGGLLFDLVGILLAAAVLLMMLGPVDVLQQIQNYINAAKGDDADTAKQEVACILAADNVPEDAAVCARAVTSASFISTNKRLFSMVFWFVLLGPSISLLYFIALQVKAAATTGEMAWLEANAEIDTLLGALDWIPARILSLALAVWSNFGATLSVWTKHLASGLNSNDQLLVDCGLAALGVDATSSNADLEENQNAVNLLERGVLTAVVVFAILSILIWM